MKVMNPRVYAWVVVLESPVHVVLFQSTDKAKADLALREYCRKWWVHPAWGPFPPDDELIDRYFELQEDEVLLYREFVLNNMPPLGDPLQDTY